MKGVWQKQGVISSALKAMYTAGSGNLHHFSGTGAFTFHKANLKTREVNFTHVTFNVSDRLWWKSNETAPLWTRHIPSSWFWVLKKLMGFFFLQKGYSLLPPLIYPSWICWFGHSHVLPPKLHYCLAQGETQQISRLFPTLCVLWCSLIEGGSSATMGPDSTRDRGKAVLIHEASTSH